MALDYRYPIELKYDQLAQLTDTANLHRIQQQYQQLSTENQRLYRKALEMHGQLVKLATALYGDGSKQVKYLNQNQPAPPMDMNKKWRKLMRRFDEWTAEERKRQSRRSSYQRRKAREEEAMTYLETAGRVYRLDFDRYSCLRDAEALRHQVEIAASVIGGHLGQPVGEEVPA